MEARQYSFSSTALPDLTRLKLTPSCSRCRNKKLKCRYAAGNSTCCIICMERGLDDLCHRDVRMTRGKRTRPENGESKNNKPDVKATRLGTQTSATETNRRAEIASLRRKLRDLESFERDSSNPITPAPSDYNPPSSSSLDGFTWSITDAEGSRKRQKQRQTEDVASMLETYAVHGNKSNTRGSSSSTSTSLPRDVAQIRWQRASSLDERLKLLRAAKQCQFASDELVVRELVSVFLYRVNHLVGHVIYSPGYQRAVEAFLNMTIEEIVMSKIFVDPCCLATMMLVLCLGFEFHPHKPPPGRAASPGFLAVQAIRSGAADPTQLWYAIARSSFAVEDSYNLTSIPALQAACLFLARGKESDGWMRMMHQVAVSSARVFGLHKLGLAEGESWMQTDDFIRLECGVRIWSYLTMRDWSLATDQNHLNLIECNQSTTRKPLNLEDEDLEDGLRESRPSSEWTSLSFVISQLELAQLIRDSATMQDRSLIREKAEEYLNRLPPYFKLNSQANYPGLLIVQRWLLLQQVFDLQLRLWRSDLASKEGRFHCLELAEKVLDHQANIRAICPIIDNLQINFFHLFGACMVILLDLIHQKKDSSATGKSNRFVARSKIASALGIFQSEAKYSRGIRILRVMLQCEEEAHSKAKSPIGSPESPGDSLILLGEHIISEIQTGSEHGKFQTERQKEIWPSLLSYRRIPDHTLLPIAGAWSKDSSDGTFQGYIGNSSSKDKPPHGSSELEPVSNILLPTGSYVFDWALGMASDPFEGYKSSMISQQTMQSSPMQARNHFTRKHADLIVSPL